MGHSPEALLGASSYGKEARMTQEIHLRLGDCLDHIKEVKPVGAVVCDPPYG